MTGAGHANKIYELTGGEALDYYQAAKLFTDVLGQTITYEPLSSQDYIAAKIAEGVPAEFADKFMQFFKMVQNGEYAQVSPAVQTVLGRAPITLKQFITDYKNQFIID